MNHSNITKNSDQPGRLVSLKSYQPKAKFTSLGSVGGYYEQPCKQQSSHCALQVTDGMGILLYTITNDTP